MSDHEPQDGVLVVTAWLEHNDRPQLRARVTSRTDPAGEDRLTYEVSADDVLKRVQEWLQLFLDQ